MPASRKLSFRLVDGLSNSRQPANRRPPARCDARSGEQAGNRAREIVTLRAETCHSLKIQMNFRFCFQRVTGLRGVMP